MFRNAIDKHGDKIPDKHVEAFSFLQVKHRQVTAVCCTKDKSASN